VVFEGWPVRVESHERRREGGRGARVVEVAGCASVGVGVGVRARVGEGAKVAVVASSGGWVVGISRVVSRVSCRWCDTDGRI
jgi:hypothetical protein